MTLPADGVQYWSCAGIHFDAREPDVHDVTKAVDGIITVHADGIALIASVNLPHGAVVTKVEVFGNAAAEAETWYLGRIKFSDGTYSQLGTANINTEDTSIDNATVDNSLYGYYFHTSTMDTNDQVYGARITYTL